MEQPPLLYIASPIFVRQIVEEESTTLVDVPPTTNRTLLKQLHFFAKPAKEPRVLLLLMKNGERICASILRLQGNRVLLNCFHERRWIQASDLVMIQHMK